MEAKDIAVLVPESYIQKLKINYDLEILACLNEPITVQCTDENDEVHSLDVYSPAIGFFSLLEMIDSEFFTNFNEFSPIEAGIALCIAIEKEKTVKDCVLYNNGNKQPLLERSAKYRDFLPDNYWQLVEWLITIPFNGMALFHGKKNSSEERETPFYFGAESITLSLKLQGEYSNQNNQDILWNTPYITTGFIYADYARFNGVKNIHRPKDSDLMEQLEKEGKEQVLKGELHPWQIENPARFPLNNQQIEANFDVLGKYENAVKEYNKIHNIEKENE